MLVLRRPTRDPSYAPSRYSRYFNESLVDRIAAANAAAAALTDLLPRQAWDRLDLLLMDLLLPGSTVTPALAAHVPAWVPPGLVLPTGHPRYIPLYSRVGIVRPAKCIARYR